MNSGRCKRPLGITHPVTRDTGVKNRLARGFSPLHSLDQG